MKKQIIKIISILCCFVFISNISIYATNIENNKEKESENNTNIDLSSNEDLDDKSTTNITPIVESKITTTPIVEVSVTPTLEPTPTSTIEPTGTPTIEITPTSTPEPTNVPTINETNGNSEVNGETETETTTPTIEPTITQSPIVTYLVEDFIGKNYEDVVNNLKNNNINPIVNFEENETYPINIIISQSIEPNSIINENEEIILIVSNGKAINDIQTMSIDSDLNTNQTNSFGLSSTNGGTNITIDGNYNDWADKPYSYEYNWDNSANCWYYGVWIDNTCYKTPEGNYDTNVRHLMQLYSDGEYLYLHIIFSKDYGSFQNGNDYQFCIDGQVASFQVETMNRENIANYPFLIGTHELFVSHRDAAMSYSQAINSKAYITVYNDKNVNNEMELMIPLSELQRQNNNINLTNIGTIEYFCPNLMYKKITCAGTNTGAIIFSILSLSTFSLIYFNKKKKEKQLLNN